MHRFYEKHALISELKGNFDIFCAAKKFKKKVM